jgi:hypothetical protein
METVLGTTKVDAVIQYLNAIEVDGETMEYIIEKVHMRDQMLRQLIMYSSNEDILELLKEKLHVPELRFQISE